MADPLEFQLYPEAETVYYSALVKAFSDVLTLIRHVDYAVTREKHGRPWAVRSLHSSVPTIFIEPVVDGTATVATLSQGLRAVNEGNTAALPVQFNEVVLSDLKHTSRLFRGSERLGKVVVRSHGLEIVTVNREIPHKVELLLRGDRTALGSIEGTLDAINIHRSRVFTIWDRVSEAAVRCSIPSGPQWAGKVAMLLGRRVLVRGSIRYLRDGRPFAIAQVEDILDRTPDTSLPKAEFGSVPDLTGDLDSVEFLRRIRG